MTETEQAVTPANDVMPRRSGGKKIVGVLFILILAVLGVGAYVLMHLPLSDILSPQEVKTASATTQLDKRLDAVEQQVQTINGRIDDLGTRINKTTTKTASDENEEGPSSQEMKSMQGDMSKLSALVVNLQAEVKQAGATAQHAAQSSMASAIAFIQLRSMAEAGRGFASELTNLRTVAPDDARFRETLDRLLPYAEKGAPVMGVLRENFINLESSVSVVIDKSAAQNWWQRVLAELRGLVSIRPVHDADSTDALAVTENALIAGKLDAALATVKTLPSDAQNVLKDWVVKVQAREAIDAALQDLSDRYVALAGSNSNPRTEP